MGMGKSVAVHGGLLMRISVLMVGGAAVAVAFAASAAFAGGPTYGAAHGQCGPGGCGTPGPVGFGPGQTTNEDYPPNAAPGQCFTKVLVPEQTEAVAEHVLVSPEKTELRVIPGVCHMEDKSVLVKEESVQLITIPATFRTGSETVVVKPGYTRTETVPATYDTVTEQVKVKDGYTAWRPGATVAGYAPGAANSYGSRPPGVYGQGVIDHNPAYGGMTTRVLPTGEVLCLVEVPPEYRTITRQVLRTPARTVEIPVPPETRIVTRQVVDVPAHVEKRVIPAVFENVKIKICTGDSTQPYSIPPVYKDYTRTNIVAPSHFEWKQVDCRTDVVHSGAQSYVAPPPHHHYAPPPRVYNAPPKPVYRKPVPAPPPPPVKHGKQCHTTTTCDGDPAPAGYAPPPPPVKAAPKPAYTKSEVTEPSATTYVASSNAGGGGDQAVVNLQSALTSRGYYSGPQNGLFTQDTMHAMVKYQEDNHLSAGRYTGETANALGISAR